MTAVPEQGTFTIYGDRYRAAIARNGEHGNECVVCGKPTGKRSLFVNLDGGPHDFGDEMGWHPIGPDCARFARAAGWEVEQLPPFRPEVS